MTIEPDITYKEFMSRVAKKFGKEVNGMALKFLDEEGNKVDLVDESDFDLALETSRVTAKGKPDRKVDIWCTES